MSTEPRTVRFAALAAPAVDRVFVGGMTACRTRGGAELGQRYGGPAATGFLVEFRTRLAAPGAAVTPAGFAALTRYRDPDDCQRVLDKQIAHGMLSRDAAGAIQATERGREYLREIYRLQGKVIGEL